MKKTTAVVLYPQFSEYELSVALSILMQGGKPVLICGEKTSPIRGESGLSCLPDKAFQEVDISEIDSLLLPGCMDVMSLDEEAALFKFLKEAGENASVIAGISSSPYLLAKAGLLKGKRYTVGMVEEARDQTGVFEKENYSDELIVQDGNIITARGRGFIEFGAAFGEALGLSFEKEWYKC
ncbi:4-methyl-5(B-hydroxyethyl)-thiazole monophosphate biosynthesis protein [Rossellomorea vietnamensis]|uniref:4-methyl-5(B-hydroxyethyl)-thiazole monophosphate biosynthesis protein n=1 Tax=Rossellomorea vietnamensis TaxID=218284 RepID=A0A5D4NWD0_9BACI|nr:DJ-1/PfpI family protein [Rossellomorea vietnamensis]TYS18655.1 4-methyl-5(B-hydroxyethyl)-thiazole monophosphate biosynthesis protein [Rossellomorea vietnamensis]